MIVVYILKSHRRGKKFDAIVNGEKVISFGAEGMEDFTIHKDEERKNRYIKRHEKREDWGNAYSAGFYSRWLLWNKPTLKESVEDLNKRFHNYHFVLRL